MTSTADTDQHPDVAEISALLEGLLPPDRTSALRAHLAECELCTEVRVSLDEIRELLGSLPGPARMPADVANRIDAALAAEALLDSTPPAHPVSRETEESEGAEQGEPQRSGSVAAVSRETADASAAKAEAPEGAFLPRAADRPAGRPRAATGPGRRTMKRRRWRTTVLGTAAALAALGIGGVVVQSLDSGQEQATAGAGKTADNSAFSGKRVEGHVRDLLTESKKAAPSTRSEAPDLGAQDTPAQPMEGNEAIVPSCVREGIDRSDAAPLASKTGTYEGVEAYLVLLPHPSDATRVDAYIVDASCVEASGTGPGDILLKRTYARG